FVLGLNAPSAWTEHDVNYLFVTSLLPAHVVAVAQRSPLLLHESSALRSMSRGRHSRVAYAAKRLYSSFVRHARVLTRALRRARRLEKRKPLDLGSRLVVGSSSACAPAARSRARQRSIAFPVLLRFS